MSIYIISNRQVNKEKQSSGKYKEVFNNDGKEKALPKFRIAECAVENGADKAGYTILKNQYPSNYSDVIKALKKPELAKKLAGSSKMFHDLYSQMLNTKDKKADVLVFIHGFANSFENNLEHIAKLKRLFIDNSKSPIEHLGYITYPTRNHKLLTYWGDQEDAWETGRVLARVYEKLLSFFVEMFKINQEENCNNKIHLAAHSMGNQVLASMLKNISRKIYPFFSEVLLLHSDVEHNVFEPGQPFTKLEALAERTHIYTHKSDDALWFSRYTKNFNKRLGKNGPKNLDNLNREIIVVDTSKITDGETFRQRAWDHWGYIESKTEIDDIIQVLNGDELDSFEKRKRIYDALYHLSN